jgi:hypothetical protein
VVLITPFVFFLKIGAPGEEKKKKT